MQYASKVGQFGGDRPFPRGDAARSDTATPHRSDSHVKFRLQDTKE